MSEKSYISEVTGLIAVLSTGAVVANQFMESPVSDQAVTAFVTAACTAIIPFVLRQIHKRKAK